jgi:Leucine-rich repeat (LRR) protein
VLQVLSIADNHLVEVCPEIGACTNLRSLLLSGNPLCTLPHTIGSCTLLAELYLEGCEIQVLPPSLSLAKGMHTLVVDQDPNTNAYWSPPNPIPSQGTPNLMRYLTEVYNYATSLRLMTPGYDLEKVRPILNSINSGIS